MPIKTLGKEIRKIRRQKGLSQRKLSELAGINHTYISKIENGVAHYCPSEEVIKKLHECIDLAPLLGTPAILKAPFFL